MSRPRANMAECSGSDSAPPRGTAPSSSRFLELQSVSRLGQAAGRQAGRQAPGLSDQSKGLLLWYSCTTGGVSTNYVAGMGELMIPPPNSLLSLTSWLPHPFTTILPLSTPPMWPIVAYLPESITTGTPRF